jgi:hypothetical protein
MKGEKEMKRKYNTEQRTYMLAKAHLETLEGVQTDMEREYITTQGVTNEDGETPNAIYCIDNSETFDRINQAFSDLPEAKSLWQEILEAREMLKAAEAALVEYGLSIAPAKQREILARAAETNYTTRIKIIDLVMRLDVATVI